MSDNGHQTVDGKEKKVAKAQLPKRWRLRGRGISPFLAPIHWSTESLRQYAQMLGDTVESTPIRPSVEDLKIVLDQTDFVDTFRMMADELEETRDNIKTEIARRAAASVRRRRINEPVCLGGKG